jgi:hydroxymethylglutaryl-CoA lyase
MAGKQYQIIECPRDAMQGWKNFIPTEKKINYINALLEVGFDTIDFGSFVSPKAIPQMADTSAVLKGLDFGKTTSRLLAIIANERGATDAVLFDEIHYLGFPFSISPTFQLRNTNSTIEQSLETVAAIQELCIKNNKELVIYLSMAFGNPYGDIYDEEMLMHYAGTMKKLGIDTISLADTVGLATPEQIAKALQMLIPAFPGLSIGVHLHTSPLNWREKLQAAINNGCFRIDGVINGYGGCPMAEDALVGNMDTLNILSLCKEKNLLHPINEMALEKAIQLANEIFMPFRT